VDLPVGHPIGPEFQKQSSLLMMPCYEEPTRKEWTYRPPEGELEQELDKVGEVNCIPQCVKDEYFAYPQSSTATGVS
jgi:hypothetical protein